jgi:hypothetical protein
MKHVVLSCLVFLGCGVSLLRAGNVITLTDGLETTGKLTLTPAAIQVETSPSPTQINLPDILEANFGETPFQSNYFSSSDNRGNQLPVAWKGQDIGMVRVPGFESYADGTLTLNGGGVAPLSKKKTSRVSDNLFFAGQTWVGDGQWTACLKEIDAQHPEASAGLMLRETLDPDSIMLKMGTTSQGNLALAARTETGKPAQMQGMSISVNLPIWLRLTRYGTSISVATSSDGTEWDPILQKSLKIADNPLVGLFVDSHKDNALAKAVFDQVSLTPMPSSAQILPPGVLLQSGSFLAGGFEHLTFDPANPDAAGNFLRNGKSVAIPRSKIAAVTMLPTARSQIAEMSSHVGLLMKNGDAMDGDFDSIDENGVRISSVLLGITTYNQSEVSACLLHPLQEQPASYEVRLRDGSIVYASGIDRKNDDLVIEEVSGVNVTVSPDEIAQFRAGSSEVQSLALLDWKALPHPSSSAPPSVNPAAAVLNTNFAATTNPAPAAIPAPEQAPPVQNWEGPNQEQMMMVPVGTTLEFPLTGKFHAMGAWIALSPDSPPNSNLTIRVLADGREIARTPSFKAGDQPRFMEVTLQDPKTVTLEADSVFADAKVLLIDPVAIRDLGVSSK